MSLLDKLLQDPAVSEVPRLHSALLVKERGLRKAWLVHMGGFIRNYHHFRRKQNSFQEILMIYMTKYIEEFYIETSIIPLTGYVDIEGITIRSKCNDE